jgi:hypothetical protein
MLSLRSRGFGTGKDVISRRDEAEDWPEIPPKSVAPPVLLTCIGGAGRMLMPDVGNDVVRECV